MLLLPSGPSELSVIERHPYYGVRFYCIFQSQLVSTFSIQQSHTCFTNLLTTLDMELAALNIIYSKINA